jgi:3-deoxy-D-manno-octulosonic-acid transferase
MLGLDLLYVALLLLTAPALIVRAVRHGKYRDGWGEKLLGRAPLRIGDRPCIWFHAVSVGEVKLLRPIITELGRRHPDWEVRVSTTTAAGLALARRLYPDLVTFYAPLDFSWAVRRAAARIRPTLLGLVELELWPNLIRAAKQAGARVAIINGRLSVRSHRGYRRFRGPLSRTFRRLDLVAAQTDEYARRFRDVGVSASRIQITGSVKYDGLESDRDNSETVALRKALGLSGSEILFVAGSTMEREEAAALEAYRTARSVHSRLRLVLVPRHPERFDRVAIWLEEHGERVRRRTHSLVSRAAANPHTSPPIYLIDTIGELGAVWGLADVAFVGGSLFPGRGGQNMMEPAAYGASVLFGPHTANFRDAVEGLLARGAARIVASPAELKSALLDDLNDPESAAERGAAARDFVLAQHGASARTLAVIDRLVEAAPLALSYAHSD